MWKGYEVRLSENCTVTQGANKLGTDDFGIK